MPQLRKRGGEVAAAPGDSMSVPAHLLSPVTMQGSSFPQMASEGGSRNTPDPM